MTYTKNMKKIKAILIPVLVFLAVFFVSVNIFSYFKNRDVKAEGELYEGEEIPVISADLKGYTVNRLYGFRSSIDPGTIRDSMIPLSGDAGEFFISKNTEGIKSVTYTITSVSTQDKIQKGKITKFQKSDKGLSFTVDTEGKTEKDTEYCLTFNLQKENGESFYYYTRLMVSDSYDSKKMLDFIMDFNEKTFDKSYVSSVGSYMYDTGAQSTDLSNIGINATGDMLVWGPMYPSMKGEPNITIKAVAENEMQAVLRYDVATDAIEEDNNIYNIYEFYYIRYDTEDDVMRFMNYNRTMEPAYAVSREVVDENGIALGIIDERSISMRDMYSEDSHYLAFTHGKDVYLYNLKDNVLSDVFGFKDTMARGMYNTKVLRVDEDGTLYFLAYGYMPEGIRAGHVGTSLYRYDQKDNSLEEILYIPSARSYPGLINDMDKMSFMSVDHDLYIMAGDSVYNIDYRNGEYVPIISGLSSYDYGVSEDGMQLALYSNRSSEDLESFNIINLDDGEIKEISVPEREKGISFIGFYGNDIIYAFVEDIVPRKDGGMDLYYKEIDVVDKDFNVLKVYKKEGRLLTGIEMDERSIKIEIVRKTDDGYKKDGTDYLLNNRDAVLADLYIRDVYDRSLGTVKYMEVNDNMPAQDPIVLSARVLAAKEDNSVTITELTEQISYYVYSGGLMEEEFSDPVKAIEYCKNVVTGSVVDSKNNVVWEDIKLPAEKDRFINNFRQGDMQGEIIRAIKNYEKAEGDTVIDTSLSMAENLSENLPDKRVLELTGLAFEDILYYVNNGTPVIGKYKDGGYVLIVGYNSNYFYGADPENGEIMDWNISAYKKEFEEMGNIFITYY